MIKINKKMLLKRVSELENKNIFLLNSINQINNVVFENEEKCSNCSAPNDCECNNNIVAICGEALEKGKYEEINESTKGIKK